MAKKESNFILGLVDEKISQDDQSDYTSSKIGGKPDWMSTNDRSPKCKICNRIMPLVVQLYAPLDCTAYHRTLYVFACITPECWNKSHSWVCLRSQMLSKVESRKEMKSCRKTPKTDKISSMFDECNDWDDGNGNNGDNDDTFATNVSRSSSGNDQTTVNFNDRIYNNNSNVSQISHAAMQMNLNEENSNCNENDCGAVAMETPSNSGEEATALIEGPEDDIISVETPEKLSSDLTSILNAAVARIDKHDVAFIPFYIASDCEYLEGNSSGENDQEFLMRYSHLEGASAVENSSTCSDMGDATYEKASYNRNDLFFHKFSKRVRYNPNQILRYCREEDASPLWLRSPIHENICRRCVSCGGRLAFEFQIMPQIINALRVQGTDSSVLEFGTVVIFTCANSCWSERSAAREEFIIIQEEIMFSCGRSKNDLC